MALGYPRKVRHPNIVLVVLDTARADSFEPYGAPRGATPAFRGLADAGHAAPAMHAASSWTLPSHAAMFTGLTPRRAGLVRAPSRTPPSCKPAMERLRPRLLPEVLRRAGYETRAVSANLWISAQTGFDTGFDEFVSIRSYRNAAMIKPGRANALRWAWQALRCLDDDGATGADAALARFLAGTGRQPFFWFVNLIECHTPYLPPSPYTPRNPVLRLRAGRAARRYQHLDGVWRTNLGGLEVSEEDRVLMREQYDRSIRLLDDWLARLQQRLDDAGRLADTILVVTSDHGENFGENGLYGHAFSLDQRLTRVPFVAAGPGAPVLDRTASLVELPRLLAEAAGIERHPWHDSVLRDGVAVSQLDEAGLPGDPRTRLAFDLLGLAEHDPRAALLTRRQTAATDGRWKLVALGDDVRAYDLVADPGEEVSLDPALAPATIHAALARATEPQAPSPDGEGDDAPLHPDLEERMRLLGYL